MRKSTLKNALYGFLGLLAVLFVLGVFKQMFPQLLETFVDAPAAEDCSTKEPIKMCPSGKMCNPETNKCVKL